MAIVLCRSVMLRAGENKKRFFTLKRHIKLKFNNFYGVIDSVQFHFYSIQQMEKG